MNRKALILATFVIASFVTGIAGQYFWPDAQLSVADLAYGIFGTFLIFAWYHVDARQCGYRRSIWLNIGVILLAIVAMPYYFFRTRGLKGGLLSTGLALALLVGTSVLTDLGRLATWYSLQA
ncbi:hypothetical protein ACFPOA_03610 [Lysobacter niabensis]|uniref:hypothetical protein n=1 Tax=Agrilutibacter niabensis TaxID=380628 RepID=UPI00361E881B